MTEYTLPTKEGTSVQFDGTRLASSTSDDGKAQRWMEYSLFKTITNLWVIERVGCSAVYHRLDSSCSADAIPSTIHDTDLDDFIPCVACLPDRPRPGEQVLMEQARRHAIVCETPEAVVQGLHNRDPVTKVTFITSVASRLLRAASKVDPDIEAAFMVQRI